MKKNELVQLHALLDVTRRFLERRGTVEPSAFAEYDALGVEPQHIHKPKGRHEAAVKRLGAALAGQLGRKLRDRVAAVGGEQAAAEAAEG